MLSFKKWAAFASPALPILFGLLLYFFAAGCRFLAYVLFGCGGLVAVFLLLHKLQGSRPKVGKCMLILLTVITCAGLAVSIWVGILIGSAMDGDPNQTCDYLIVLGAGVNGTTPSQSLQERIDAAAEYLLAHPQVQCILSGGKGNGEDISEAECMFRRLTAKGVPAQQLWLEDRSTSTRENLQFSLALIREKTGSAPEELGILSSNYHLYRAGRFAREQGVSPICIGAKTERIELFISYFVREIFAVCFYTVFG